MGKLNGTIHGKIVRIVIVLSAAISSCTGQEKNGETQEVINKAKIRSIDSNLKETQVNIQSIETSFPLLYFDNRISEVVRTIFQDSKGNIWFGTQNGAFCQKGKTLTHIDGIKSETSGSVTIKDIAEDQKGRIWIGHTDGVSVLDGASVTNYYQSDGLVSNDVWSIMIDKNNQVWIGTINGVCKFDGKEFTTFKIPEGKLDTTKGVSSTTMIHDIMEDSQGRIWFSTNGGAYIKDKDVLTNISERDGLKTSFVNEIIEDKKGSFWISTAKGLFNYTDKTLKNITQGIIEKGKGTGTVTQDSEGNIWFTSNLREIYSFNGFNFTKYLLAEGSLGPTPFEIYEDRQKRLWFVGYGGAYLFENGKFIHVTKNGPW